MEHVYYCIFLVFNIWTIENYLDIRPDKWCGKPWIKGAMIFLYDVLNWLANGITT